MRTADLLEIVSPAVKALNPALFPAVAPAPVAPPMAEKDLQQSVEDDLAARLYYRMTAPNFAAAIRGTISPRGFFGHWTECERNPLISDLLVVSWPVPRPPLLLELKVRDSWQPGQKQAISLKLWNLAWDLAEARSIIEAWETGETK